MTSDENKTLDMVSVNDWLQLRKQEGPNINPETAEVTWWYALTLDPYGVDPELPEEYRQLGREYFARSPGSDTWIWFGDLPSSIREALWRRHGATLAFSAGPLA